MERKEWWVWGLVYAPVLPAGTAITIDDGLSIDVLVLEKSFADDLFNARLRTGFKDWDTTYIAMQPWEPELRSQYALRFRVRAEEETPALEVAKKWLPWVVAALETVADGPCHAVLLRVQNSKTGQSMYTATQAFTPLARPVETTDEQASTFFERLSATIESATAQRVSALLFEAGRMDAFSRIHDFARGPAMLAYYKVLEGVVSASAPAADPEDVTVELTAAIEDLQSVMAASDDVEHLARAIRQAHDRIRRAQLGFASTRVEAAATQLGLSRELREEAKAFVKLRNSWLGHYRDDDPNLGIWLEGRKARRVAISFFSVYLGQLAAARALGSSAAQA